MPQVKYGNTAVEFSWREYLACLLPSGTPVEFYKYSPGGGKLESQGTGIFKMAWQYDGIIAKVDIGGGHMISLFLGFGFKDKMKRLKDTKRLVGEGCQGEGI